MEEWIEKQPRTIMIMPEPHSPNIHIHVTSERGVRGDIHKEVFSAQTPLAYKRGLLKRVWELFNEHILERDYTIIEQAITEAEEELEEELFRVEVGKQKEKIINKRKHKWFPWKIKIERR